MKSYIKKVILGVMSVGLVLTGTVTTSADSSDIEPISADGEDIVIDEKWGKPVYVYGGTLTDNEVITLAELLGYDMEELDAIPVEGKDQITYLGEGNPDANMYSSAVITRTSKGSGIDVTIATPENITKITEDQYTNAMITAGVEDADVVVDSLKTVTGESALTGIYKAYDEKGEELDKDRMEVAQLELETTAEVAEGLDGDEKAALDDALVEIKQQLSEIKEGQLTEEKVEEIVNKALEKRGLDSLISADDIARLVNLGFKYGQTGAINSEAVKEQLQDLSDSVGEKLGDFKDWADDTGLWSKIGQFFKDILGAITGLFSSGDSN